ncbi:putative hemin transport protein [Pararhizobium capsulatum DSM 1112]|uniref:Hemin transport protein n=1 Tax=Pararhizobium capsulatum DSM 1112 TaxID=1121113 RepID=A0ABU0BV74_9HYPH|nr:ChuX/HutX family heme-like substrate-binding protein [Pararhizobium capsulatum]MDQ0321365.1 putative hemin transport protein [Pararhizobium capsulatum DSM 1112]
MTTSTRPTPVEIRAYRAENSKMRERDIAAQLGVSEAALVAAECGLTAIRIDGSANRFLERAPELGTVMALTRNESAVHEKIGPFEKASTGPQASIVLGSEIDLRVFPRAWAYGFAVAKTDGENIRHSLQFFDKQGVAVHKVHLRPESNLGAYHAIVADFRLDDQSQEFVEKIATSVAETEDTTLDVAELRDRWSKMTDTHQFHGLLRNLKVGRRQALHSVGEEYAWLLAPSAVEQMMRDSAAAGLPIMCFVGNHGMIQIHSGPIETIQQMGPWINIFDPTFHLHLRADHLAEVWAVRKPTADGHVTSLEALDAKGEMVIQFFGKRKEGFAERPEWRAIMEGLQKLDTTAAA